MEASRTWLEMVKATARKINWNFMSITFSARRHKQSAKPPFANPWGHWRWNRCHLPTLTPTPIPWPECESRTDLANSRCCVIAVTVAADVPRQSNDNEGMTKSAPRRRKNTWKMANTLDKRAGRRANAGYVLFDDLPSGLAWAEDRQHERKGLEEAYAKAQRWNGRGEPQWLLTNERSHWRDPADASNRN